MKQELQTTCPFCSLHCADLRLTIDGGRLTRFSPPCKLGRSRSVEAWASASATGQTNPVKSSLRIARRLLQNARRLLVVLSTDVSNEAVESAIRLAKDRSAVLAVEEESGNLLSLAMKTTGFLAGTLGELRSLDVVLLCGVDPAATHPRLGEFIRKDITDQALALNPADPFETIRWLRLGMSEHFSDVQASLTGILNRIRSVASGVAFFGPQGLQAGQPLATELLLWLRDLNRSGRWYAQPLFRGTNSQGVTETLLSTTGYASGINFSDTPGFSPHRWQAGKLIAEGWLDLCLLVGQPRSFGMQTLARLHKIKTIVLDPHPPAWNPSLWLPVAQSGLDSHGTMQRLDGVPFRLEPILETTRMPLETILDALGAETLP